MVNVDHFLFHEATVEPLTGEGAYGDVYGAPVAVPCFAESERSLVRDSAGQEVVSEGAIYTELSANIPVGSKVTVFGRTSQALQVKRHDDAGRLTTLAHLEVRLS